MPGGSRSESRPMESWSAVQRIRALEAIDELCDTLLKNVEGLIPNREEAGKAVEKFQDLSEAVIPPDRPSEDEGVR